MELPEPEDDSDRQLLADVLKFGWHMISIPADEAGPSYTFTVGLYHSFQHPEIALFGLGTENEQAFINTVALAAKQGNPFDPKAVHSSFADGCAFTFVPMAKEFYRPYLGYARWFYRAPFPALQMVWSDRTFNFPWDKQFDQSLIAHQPVFAEDRKRCWPFRCAKNTSVFAHVSVAESKSPVLKVSHDEEGDWQFLDGYSTNASSNARLVSLFNIVEKDPSLFALADLPRGSYATRHNSDEPWTRHDPA